jgi:tRNA-Thr(GGU) m(6)t(6)A37 methyltransferase TsaA
MADFSLRPVGCVESILVSVDDAPRQPDEGALDGLDPGMTVLVLTWLDRADRDTLAVHPRSDPTRPLTGVFATRSPDRPNPIGLHEVQILAISGLRVHVHALEALDGTPILDVKPLLSGVR